MGPRSYELLSCGWRGHALAGADAADLSGADPVLAHTADGVRWHRCLRCDSWVALDAPDPAARERVPARDQIELPLRGKPLRDQLILRVIAVERALHFLILGLLSVAVLLFAAHRADLRGEFYRVVSDLQSGVGGGPVQTSSTGALHVLDRLFTLRTSSLDEAGIAIGVYALLEGIEAIGLWRARRWAEYLTFIATTVLLPLEIYELSERITWFKALALLVNIAVVIYLIAAKRLFGVRGGARAVQAERDAALGWAAIERATPTAGPGALRAPA
jgi:uncharacterized membrane protein (DUF2068 family)